MYILFRKIYTSTTTFEVVSKRRLRKMSYDPDPRRRRKHGPRKGVEPSGLKRWRLAHTRTHDPGRRRPKRTYSGPRGGRAWIGPRKRRYDPPRQTGGGFAGYRSRHPRASGFLGKAGATVDRYAMIIGAALGFGVPAYQSMQSMMWTKGARWIYWFTEGIPNAVQDLFCMRSQTPEWGKGLNLVLWKFTNPQSHWMMPFWISAIGSIVLGFARDIAPAKFKRPMHALQKMSTGATIATLIGGLFCPGSNGNVAPSGTSITSTQTELAHYA